MPDKKSDIQKQIENIDIELYNLLMKRTELVKENPQSVKIENILGQEAMTIRRMLKYHTGDFPEYVVAKIWREILSASACLHKKLKIAVYGEEQDISILHRVQEHFGSYVDVSLLSSYNQVFNMVSTHEAQLAIVPCYNHEMNEKPWWNALSAQKEKESLNIVARLPFVRHRNIAPENEAYVFALSPSDASGIDNSVLSVECDVDVSNSTIFETLIAMGFDDPKLLASANVGEAKFTLIEVKGYVDSASPSLQDASELFKGLHLAGTYARPIEL